MLRVASGLRCLKVQLFLILCISLSLYACGSDDAGTSSSQSNSSVTKLSGPESDLANLHLPRIEFPETPSDDVVDTGSLTLCSRDLFVIFKDSASVGEVNALLQSLGAEISGGLPETHLLLLRLTGPSDLQRLLDAQATLISNPIVAAASINTVSSPDMLPPHNIRVASRQVRNFAELNEILFNLLKTNPTVRVLNFSTGDRHTVGVDPVNTGVDPKRPVNPYNNRSLREQINLQANILLTELQAYEFLSGEREFLMFCSAGNERKRAGTTEDYEARDNSPCANLAVRGIYTDPLEHWMEISAPFGMAMVAQQEILQIYPTHPGGTSLFQKVVMMSRRTTRVTS